MKKTVFFIIIFFVFTTNIYSIENEWTDEKITDKEIIETQIRYRFYKPILFENKYEVYNFDYKNEYDLNDYIYTEYSNWNEEYPESKFYREIEEKTETINDTMFNSINIYNFKGTNNFTIKGIVVTINSLNKIIYYELLGNEYIQSENLKGITNRISNPGVNFNSNSILYLNFPEYYEVNDIKISIYYNSNSILNKSFDLSFNNSTYKVKYKTVNLVKHYAPIDNIDVYSNSFITNENLNKLKYRYKDKLFNRKTFIKEYKDGYFEELEEYNKDLDTAKIFYKYKNKDEYICESKIIKEEIVKEKIKTEFINTIIKEPFRECLCEKCSKNIEKSIIKNINCESDKKSKINYNYNIIVGSIFLIIGFVLYLLILFLKKLVNICRTK